MFDDKEVDMVQKDIKVLGAGYMYDGKRIDPVKLYCFIGQATPVQVNRAPLVSSFLLEQAEKDIAQIGAHTPFNTVSIQRCLEALRLAKRLHDGSE